MEKCPECVDRSILPDPVQQPGMWLDALGRYIGLYAADADSRPARRRADAGAAIMA
jgi:hypothetical protein